MSLAFDENIKIDGIPFLNYYKDRVSSPTTNAYLNTLTKKLSGAVFQLDLATEQIVGKTGADVSYVLFNKVIQQLG